jgi:hypothetical protein
MLQLRTRQMLQFGTRKVLGFRTRQTLQINRKAQGIVIACYKEDYCNA